MKTIIFTALLWSASSAFADTIRCYPVAQNINGTIVVSEKCENVPQGVGPDFLGNYSYPLNSPIPGVGWPAPQVVESAVRGMALGKLYSIVPYSWILVR
jgi:hypothetical protein